MYLYSTIGFLRFCLPNVYVHCISQSKLDPGNCKSERENIIWNVLKYVYYWACKNKRQLFVNF